MSTWFLKIPWNLENHENWVLMIKLGIKGSKYRVPETTLKIGRRWVCNMIELVIKGSTVFLQLH